MAHQAPIISLASFRKSKTRESPARGCTRLDDILVISICALLCGAESFEDMEVFGEAKQEWFATFLELPHGISQP
jgi:hypothetical protein